jgi:hypothetical protein
VPTALCVDLRTVASRVICVVVVVPDLCLVFVFTGGKRQ